MTGRWRESSQHAAWKGWLNSWWLRSGCSYRRASHPTGRGRQHLSKLLRVLRRGYASSARTRYVFPWSSPTHTAASASLPQATRRRGLAADPCSYSQAPSARGARQWLETVSVETPFT